MAKGGKTIDDVCEVLRWSFVCMATGQMPTARHDGSPWGEGISVGKKSSDHRRKKQAQSSIGVKGVLAEIRGSRRTVTRTRGLLVRRRAYRRVASL